MIIFTGRPLPPPPPALWYQWYITLSHAPHLRVLEVHIIGISGISIVINESKIHISYLRNHDSTLMLSYIIFICHPFHPSPISLLRVHLNGIGNVTIHLKVPKNYINYIPFHTNVCHVRLFLQKNVLTIWRTA